MTDTTQAAGLTDERQMFEQWLTDNRYDSGKYDANHLMAGVYHNHTTRLYWEAWRGRAALAAQAVPEGDDISLTFAVQHALNVLQDVHMYGGSDLGPSMWQQVSNAIEFCDRALAAAPQPPAPSEQRKPQPFNEWWMSLPAGSRHALIGSPWTLAEVAYCAGIRSTGGEHE